MFIAHITVGVFSGAFAALVAVFSYEASIAQALITYAFVGFALTSLVIVWVHSKPGVQVAEKHARKST